MSESINKSPSPVLWSFPSWINTVFLGLHSLVIILSWMVLGFTGLWISQGRTFWFFPLIVTGIVLISILTIAIHEIGHFAGAKWGGMIPYRMQIGMFDIKIENTSWRFRWCKPALKADGYLLSYPDIDKPLRGQHLRMIVCGPLANIMAALMFGVFAFLMDADLLRWFFSGFAVVNIAMGVANLIPVQKLTLASDGLNLIRWWRGMDEESPELVLHRIYGLSIKGVTADKIPADKLALLEHMPFPMPIMHTWCILKAHQTLSEWEQAAAVDAIFNKQIAELNPDQLKAMQDMVALLRFEILFSRSLIENRFDESMEEVLTKNLDWFCPYLRSRCKALQSALKGDSQSTALYLDDAEREAARSLDRALWISEVTARNAIYRILPANMRI